VCKNALKCRLLGDEILKIFWGVGTATSRDATPIGSGTPPHTIGRGTPPPKPTPSTPLASQLDVASRPPHSKILATPQTQCNQKIHSVARWMAKEVRSVFSFPGLTSRLYWSCCKLQRTTFGCGWTSAVEIAGDYGRCTPGPELTQTNTH